MAFLLFITGLAFIYLGLTLAKELVKEVGIIEYFFSLYRRIGPDFVCFAAGFILIWNSVTMGH